jgi:hypothetical protein
MFVWLERFFEWITVEDTSGGDFDDFEEQHPDLFETEIDEELDFDDDGGNDNFEDEERPARFIVEL